MTNYYQRLGECNRCGQCCGAPGGPDRRTPFPRNAETHLRHNSLDDVNKLCPQLTMLGLTMIAEDTIGVASTTGHYRVQGQRFYYVWLPKLGVMKDASAAHDGSAPEPECPFLLPDPGPGDPAAGTRPCGLVGTNDDGAYKTWCEQEPTSPRDEKFVLEWQQRYPGCSYSWQVIP
jgi:Fe-S-cluster containining protein